MRFWFVSLSLLAAAACGKQLNPDYCMDHEGDPDCRSAGYVFTDAAGPCQSDSECTDPGKTVCDLAIHACVQCAGADKAACQGNALVCSSGDICVECVTNTDCAQSGVCLTSNNTCAPPDSILHAAAAGSPTGTCSDTAKCTLDHAIAIADAGHHVIQLDNDGTYNMTATLTLALEGIHLVPTIQGTTPKITNTAGGKVFQVNATAELDSLEIQGSSDAIVACQGATLVIESSFIHGTSKDAIALNGCSLTLEKSRIAAAQESGVYAQSSTVHIRNNFFYGNGSTDYLDAPLSFNGSTSGEAEFNTVAYNTAATTKSIDFHGHIVDVPHPAGVSCNQNDNESKVMLNGNLFVEDKPEVYSINTLFNYKACTGDFTVDNLMAAANDAAFVSTSDLHITTGTASGTSKVRDDGNSNCANVNQDIDGDTRPQNGACDYGADELKSN
ncbi:MAG TPA: hypothetical protein VGC41_25465 [Kofleriaceae bacterium]